MKGNGKGAGKGERGRGEVRGERGNGGPGARPGGGAHGEVGKGKRLEEQKESAEDFQAKLMALKKKFK
jgi:hypothetical protein